MIITYEPSAGRLVATVVAVILIGYAVKFVTDLYRARTALNGLPKPPHSFLFGHLITMGKLFATLPPNVHPQMVICYLREQYNLPPIFYLDTFPFSWPVCAIIDPEVAHQVTVQNPLPKHECIKKTVWPVVGHNSLVSIEGVEHKKWRAIFNPGFSPAHLMTLVDGIVDDAMVFLSVLSKHADSGKVFHLEDAATKATVDIIGRVVLGVTMHAQTSENAFVRAFRSSVVWLLRANDYNIFHALNPVRPLVFWHNKRVMNKFLNKVMDDRFALRAKGRSPNSKASSCAAIDLAIDAYLIEVGAGSDAKFLDPAFKAAAMDHVKVFMFGGHDTSSSTICYIVYELSKHPEALARVRREYDDILGSDVSQIGAKIKGDPYVINRLPYTAAVIKETLRLWPPGSSTRMGQPGYFLHFEGKQYPTEGCLTWPVARAIQTDPTHWSEPLAFKPERWLLSENDRDAPKKGAWRPFEWGPRNCIGQELAMMEMKVIMALMLQTFDVRSAYDEWDLNSKNKGPAIKTTPDGNRGYQILLGTAKPVDGMPAKVKRR